MITRAKNILADGEDHTEKFSYDPQSLYNGFGASRHRIVKWTEPLTEDELYIIKNDEDCFDILVTSASFKDGDEIRTKQIAIPAFQRPQRYFLLLNDGTNGNEAIKHDNPKFLYELVMDLDRLGSRDDPEREEGRLYVDKVYLDDMKAALSRKRPD